MTAHDPRPGGMPPNPATHRTDATAHPHDADALDAWLESVTVPSDCRIAALNVHAPAESAQDSSSLVATAREFHTRIGDAERGPVVPESEIWERIMSNHLVPQPNQAPNGRVVVAPGVPGSAAAPSMPDVVADDTPPKRSAIVDILTGTHPAISILLAAAVVLAILAVFRSFGEFGNAPVMATEAPLDARVDDSGERAVIIPGSGDGAGFGAMSPVAGTPASPATSGACHFEELGSGDGSRPLADYAPAGRTIADSTTVEQVNNDALTISVGCSDGGVTLAQFLMSGDAASNEIVTFIQDTWNIDHGHFARSTLDVDTRNALKDDDAAVWIVDPATVVELPDGRVGAIAYRETRFSGGNGRDLALFATVVIFRPSSSVEPPELVLDEIFPLCNSNNGEVIGCDAATIKGIHESTPIGGSTDVTPVHVIKAPTPTSLTGTPASPPASGDCGFEDLGAGDGSHPLSNYTPSGAITDPGTLDQVNDALTDAVGCSNGDITLAQFDYPYGETSHQIVTFVRENWNVDPNHFARTTLDVETRNSLRADDRTVWIIDPETLVALPDGRIGAITYKRDMMSSGNNIGLILFARVVIFTPSQTGEPGGLVLDEIFQLCTPNGETFHCDAATLKTSHESPRPVNRPM